MDALERLPIDTVLGSSLTASEHVQRYRWAASGCSGLRVLDLCCGVGYGSVILDEHAQSVTGVDYDSEAITEARTAAENSGAGAQFEVGDAIEWLERDLAERFDAIVCFEGLEHLTDFDHALERLRRHANQGVRLFLSLPNSRTFSEENRFHVTSPDLETATAAFESLAGSRRFFQYVSEGSMVLAADAEPEPTAALFLPDRAEPEYANTFLCAVNVPEEALEAATAHMRMSLMPYLSRQLQSLAHANAELWNTNRQLRRQVTDLAREADLDRPPLAAARSYDVGAGHTIAKLMARTDVAEKRLAAMAEELQQARSDAAVGWGRYHALRNRKAVRLALAAARLIR